MWLDPVHDAITVQAQMIAVDSLKKRTVDGKCTAFVKCSLPSFMMLCRYREGKPTRYESVRLASSKHSI